MSKFIGNTEAECNAFRAGVEFADDSGEVKFGEPVQQENGLWVTRLEEDEE